MACDLYHSPSVALCMAVVLVHKYFCDGFCLTNFSCCYILFPIMVYMGILLFCSFWALLFFCGFFSQSFFAEFFWHFFGIFLSSIISITFCFVFSLSAWVYAFFGCLEI